MSSAELATRAPSLGNTRTVALAHAANQSAVHRAAATPAASKWGMLNLAPDQGGEGDGDAGVAASGGLAFSSADPGGSPVVGDVNAKSDGRWPDPGAYSSGGAAGSVAMARQDSAQAVPYQQEMEGHFGADFSGVKAYTGSSAQEACDAMGAKAMAFGSGEVAFKEANPDKPTVAHELTHVLQQGSGAGPSRSSLSTNVVDYNAPQEVEARAVERQVASGGPVDQVAPGGLEMVDVAQASSWAAAEKKIQGDDFWEAVRDVIHEKVQDWIMTIYSPAIEQFSDAMNSKGEKGWGQIAWDTVKSAIGLIPKVGGIVSAVIGTLEAVIGKLTSQPGTFEDFMLELRGTVATLKKETETLSLSDVDTYEQWESDATGANDSNYDQDTERKAAISLLKADVAKLESKSISDVMRPFVDSWVNSATDGYDMDSDAGIIEIKLMFDHPSMGTGLALAGSPYIDDVERPDGTLKALEQAYGKEFLLGDLPYPIHLAVHHQYGIGVYRSASGGGNFSLASGSGVMRNYQDVDINELWNGTWATDKPKIKNMTTD